MANTNYPTLNFPPIRLRARKASNGRTEVFDQIRGRWLVLTPEEWVRRHVVGYLLSHCNIMPQQIVEEYPVAINGMSQRADIVVLGNKEEHLLVVECKEPNVKIDNDVLSQVVRYNSVLGCRYIVMTNGIDSYCYCCEDGKYIPIDHFPHL